MTNSQLQVGDMVKYIGGSRGDSEHRPVWGGQYGNHIGVIKSHSKNNFHWSVSFIGMKACNTSFAPRELEIFNKIREF